MSSGSQQPDAAAYEQLIFQVRGIQAARVVTSANGAIDEVHVVGLPGRSAKQMVRDIESILYVQGGVRLDHRKVSLVQLDEGSAQVRPPRLLLIEVSCAPEGGGVSVTLGLREQRAQGTAAASKAEGDAWLLATARATLGAILQLIGPRIDLSVEQMALERFGHLNVCLSHLAHATDNGLETLLGISMVRDDVSTAAARAVLDAVNRPLVRLIGD